MNAFYKILVLLVLAAIIFVSSFLVSSKTPSAKPFGQEIPRASSRQILADLSAKVNEKLEVGSQIKPDQTLQERVREDLATVKNSANFFNVDETRSSIYSAWAKDERMMQAIRAELLQTEDDRGDLAGSLSAELRYFGIQALLHVAKQGESHLLDETLQAFARDFSKHSAIAKDAGRLTDFKDLIHAKMQVSGFEQLSDFQNLTAFLSETGLADVREPDLMKAIDDEIFLFLYPKLGKAQANKLLASALPHEGGDL